MQIIQRWGKVLGAGAIVAVLSACAAPYNGGYPQSGYPVSSQPSYPAAGYPTSSYPSQYPSHVQQVRVLNIETVRVQDGSGVGAGGAIVGGVVGGLLGHQIGGGSGKALATAAGVVGGALAGNAVQNNMGGGSVRDIYRVTVQLRDGSTRAFDYEHPPQFGIGEYVRFDGQQIYR